MRLLPILITCLIVLHACNAKTSNKTPTIGSVHQLTSDTWSTVEESIWPVLSVRSQLSSTLSNANVSSECNSALRMLISGLDHHQLWAFEMIDASSKMESSLTYQFGITNIGSEEYCLSINHTNILGSYSMLNLAFPVGSIAQQPMIGQPSKHFYETTKDVKMSDFDVRIIVTICHPHLCSVSDIANLIDTYFDHRVDYNIKSSNRTLKRHMSDAQVFSLAMISILVAFTLASTIKCNIIPSFPIGNKYFDILENYQTVKRRYQYQDSVPSDTDFLNGWKTFYLFFSIVSHFYLILEKSMINLSTGIHAFSNYHRALMESSARFALLGIGLNIGCTAILTAITMIPFIKSMKEPSPKIFAMATILRYLRLIPITMFSTMILIVTPLVTIKNSGIFHNSITESASNTCSTYVWYDIFFMSNFLKISQMCFPINWFLSADFQLAMITFPLILTLASDLRKGIKLASFYVFIGIVLEYYLISNFDRRILTQYHELSTYDTLHMSLCSTGNYIGSYVIALTVGTLIYRGIKIPFLVKYNNAMQLASFGLLSASVILTYPIDHWTYELWIKNFIGSLIRTTDAFIVCLWFYLVWASDASLVKRLFTIAPIINTIGKIILPAFIAHFMLLVWTESIMHSKSIEFSVMYTISIVLLIFPLSIIGGMILHILIELPFMKLMKSKLMKKKE